jgi:uncharacterized protein involved in exopolysaccharide biosynthesis
MEQSIIQTNRSDVIAFFATIVRWRFLFIRNITIVVIIAIIYSLLIPKWYKSTVSLLPPKDQSSVNPFANSNSLIRSLSSLQKIGGLGANQGTYSYLAILKSRSAMEAVVEKFDLIHVYDIADNSMEKAIKALSSNVAFEIQDEDYITITFFDTDPKRAADIANYFVDVLNGISTRVSMQEARNNREFIEKRMIQTKEVLRSAEDSLKHFQQKSGFVVSNELTASGISAIAELYGMKVKKEIEIGILERLMSIDSPELERARRELMEINKKVSLIPQVGIETIRLYREVAIQQKILEYIIPLYEQAKVDEQKQLPVILVLDKAIPAEKKAKPLRIVIVVLAAFFAFIISLVYIFIIEMYQRLMQNPSTRALIENDIIVPLKRSTSFLKKQKGSSN